MTYDFKEALNKYPKSIEFLIDYLRKTYSSGDNFHITFDGYIFWEVEENQYAFNPLDMDYFFDQQNIIGGTYPKVIDRELCFWSVVLTSDRTVTMPLAFSRDEALVERFNEQFSLLERRLTA